MPSPATFRPCSWHLHTARVNDNGMRLVLVRGGEAVPLSGISRTSSMRNGRGRGGDVNNNTPCARTMYWPVDSRSSYRAREQHHGWCSVILCFVRYEHAPYADLSLEGARRIEDGL